MNTYSTTEMKTEQKNEKILDRRNQKNISKLLDHKLLREQKGP